MVQGQPPKFTFLEDATQLSIEPYIIPNDYMKKQSSTSQFISVRDKGASSVTAPAFESARGTRKRKLTDKSEPAGLSSISIKQPLGPSTLSNISATIPVKNKIGDSQSICTSKRTKENLFPATKKASLSTVCRDSKASLRAHLDIRNDRYSVIRPSKTPARKENIGSSSRVMEQSMIEVRNTEFPSRDLQMILEAHRQEGYSMHLHTIMSESKQDQDQDDAEPLVRQLLEDIVQGMFKGNELRLRGLQRENQLLKEELLKIKFCFEGVEKDRLEKIDALTTQMKTLESETEGLRITKHKNECLVAELQYRLAQARQDVEDRNCNQLSELEIQVQGKEAELANYRSKLDVCERQSDTFKRELVTTKKENVVLRKENCHYRSTYQFNLAVLEENEGKLNESSTTIAELQVSVDSSRRMIHSLEAQLMESQSQLRVPQSELVSGLKEMVAQSSSEVFRLNREMSSMEIKLAIIERRHLEELERLKGVHNKELRMWRQRNKKLVKCNATLKRMVEEKEDISIDFSLNDEKDVEIR